MENVECPAYRGPALRERIESEALRHCDPAKRDPGTRGKALPPKQSLQRSPRSQHSLAMMVLVFFFSFFLSPLAAFAQMGPCSAEGTCSPGQTCYDPPEGDRQCFKNCTPAATGDAFADTGCPAGQACAARPPGAPATIDGLCVSLEGATPDFTAVESPTTTEDELPTGSAETKPFQSITPELGVDIPGLEFTPAQKVGDDVFVPFLAQYINALYRYAVGIVLVASIVMVVWGGFRYLIGSSYGDVARGKEIIRDALAGMLIVIGAYLILQTVNPDTANLSVLQLAFVKQDPFARAEDDIDFMDSVDNYTYAPAAPGAPPDASALEYCERLRPFIEDGTVVIPNGNDRRGILSGAGFIERPAGSQWCQHVASGRSDPPQCSDLPTLAQFEQASGGRPVTYDDPTEGVPIHPQLCRYLYDLALAKRAGQIQGMVRAKIVGTHMRCSSGAWFFVSAASNNNCTTLKSGRERCLTCVQNILSGSDRGQSKHWTGFAFDMTQNDSVQRYTVQVLAPRYKEENGGSPVIRDVFGNVLGDYTGGPVDCTTRRGSIRTPTYCHAGRCDGSINIGTDIVCGHTSLGSNSHIHISFY